MDSPAKVPLKDDVLKHIIQSYLVPPVGGGGKPDKLLRPEVVKDCPVGPGRRVVGLVADDEPEVLRPEAVQPPHQGLHAGRDHLLTVAVVLRPLYAVGAGKVLPGLLHQLLSVAEDQHPLSVPGEVGEGDSLPHPCGHLHQVGAGILGLDGVDALLLIGSQFQSVLLLSCH